MNLLSDLVRSPAWRSANPRERAVLLRKEIPSWEATNPMAAREATFLMAVLLGQMGDWMEAAAQARRARLYTVPPNYSMIRETAFLVTALSRAGQVRTAEEEFIAMLGTSTDVQSLVEQAASCAAILCENVPLRNRETHLARIIEPISRRLSGALGLDERASTLDVAANLLGRARAKEAEKDVPSFSGFILLPDGKRGRSRNTRSTTGMRCSLCQRHVTERLYRGAKGFACERCLIEIAALGKQEGSKSFLEIEFKR